MRKSGFLVCLGAFLLMSALLLVNTPYASAKGTATGELLDAAKIMVAGAQNKAEKIKVPMVISVVDMDGNLVLLHRMEGSLLASLEISPNKAFTAVALKMPSSNVKQLAQQGQELQGIAVQHAGRIVEFGGGLPIYDASGKQIGGIGVSGGSVAEDTSVAQAGLDAYKKAKEIKAASGGVLLDKAILAVNAAEKKAIEIDVPMVISFVDMGGNLVLLHRMENSLLASLEIAPNKAFTAVALKMPSAKVKELAQQGQELQGIAVQHAGRLVEFGGGIPVYDKSGKQIGAIGVSGGSVAEDTTVAEAAVAAMAD
ncbi:MAG: heme-binding protein [Selenomonadaceae bacterium]|nr:heme-binding protein [Selenomonadaceae bacterium]